MIHELYFPIIPTAKQSFRFAKSGIKYQPKAIKDNVNTIKALLINQLPAGHIPTSKPVYVSYMFAFPYPKSMPKYKRGSQFRLYKETKPDLDNLQKAINDALNNSVFVDDSQIVSCKAEKYYDTVGYIKVIVQEIE